MDYSQFRRSTNVEPPRPVADPLFALIYNPLRSQWIDPLSLNNNVRVPELAKDFPNSPGPDQSIGPLSYQAGLGDLIRMMLGAPTGPNNRVLGF